MDFQVRPGPVDSFAGRIDDQRADLEVRPTVIVVDWPQMTGHDG